MASKDFVVGVNNQICKGCNKEKLVKHFVVSNKAVPNRDAPVQKLIPCSINDPNFSFWALSKLLQK